MGWTDSAVRRYVRDAGPAADRAERAHPVRLHDAQRAQGGEAVDGGWTISRSGSSSWPPSEELAAIRPELDGGQVMEHLGIGPGPVVGKALAFLLEIRLDEGIIGDTQIRQRLDQWAARSVAD